MSAGFQNLLKLTVDQMYEGIQILDRDWRYLYVNAAAGRHGRSEPARLVGSTILDSYPGIENSEVFRTMNQVMLERQPRFMENLFDYPDGSKCWFDIYMEPHKHGILIRSIDVTDRKAIQEQYWRAQKLEAIGNLTAGIAHDFNNKLGVITLFADMALEGLKEHDEAQRVNIQSILEATNQASVLTRQLLGYARKQILDLHVLNLNDLVRTAQESLRYIVSSEISVQYFLADNLGNVRVDASQIDQILLNLCINARDAMPGGGSLIVETSNVELDAEYCKERPEIAPGPYVMLSVSDTGLGMAPEVKKRIFEPFYTTKSKGKGTGLGLPMVQGIVAQSHGHIWVYSELGVGTTVKCYFPLVDEAKEMMPNTGTRGTNFGGNETVLLIEDDGLLRSALEQSLIAAGYTVMSAGTSEQAEIHFTENRERIALILTDVILPKVNGRAMAESFLRRLPDVKVIFMSGYTDNSIGHQSELGNTSVLIQKPISQQKLLETMRRVLDGLPVQRVI